MDNTELKKQLEKRQITLKNLIKILENNIIDTLQAVNENPEEHYKYYKSLIKSREELYYKLAEVNLELERINVGKIEDNFIKTRNLSKGNINDR